MKRNEAPYNRIIRAVLAALFAALVIIGIVKGTWAIVLGILGAILLITALTGFCGIYYLLGISTVQKKEKERKRIQDKR